VTGFNDVGLQLLAPRCEQTLAYRAIGWLESTAAAASAKSREKLALLLGREDAKLPGSTSVRGAHRPP